MTGRRGFARSRGGSSEWNLIPAREREQFCIEVLTSIGVTSYKRQGDELIISCPLPFGLHAHGDSHPSAALNVAKGAFNCLGCGSGGGVSWLVAVCKGISTSQARQEVSSRMVGGTSLPEILAYLERIWADPETVEDEIPVYSMRILEPWVSQVHPYVLERGVSMAQVERFLVGYDPRTKRVVIPHFWGGQLVGWQSRRLVADGSPKYLSSAAMPKAQTIFNYDPKAPEAVVVESPMSVLIRDDHPAVEATFGAMVTAKQVRLLARHDSVVLAMDPDQAGWNATLTLGEELNKYTKVWVVDNDWDADMGDLDHERFVEVMANKVPFAVWTPPTSLRTPTWR